MFSDETKNVMLAAYRPLVIIKLFMLIGWSCDTLCYGEIDQFVILWPQHPGVIVSQFP